jgi:hypothetical protein
MGRPDHIDEPGLDHAEGPTLHGVMAMFESGEDAVRAAQSAYAAGFRRMDAYSPHPVDGLAEAIGYPYNWMRMIVLVSGLLGGIGGYGLQYYSAVMNYPINVGGKPFHSLPNFIPITFETTVLAAAIGAVVGMLGLNGLPRPHHPVFNVPEFDRASSSGFFLCILADDPQFDAETTTKFLEGLGPSLVTRVED